MKCIVCDRCKTIIEDVRKCRVVSCARPLKPEVVDKPPYRGNDPKLNDILWSKDLCSDCIEELEAFFDPVTSGTPSEETGTTPGGSHIGDGTQDIE